MGEIFIHQFRMFFNPKILSIDRSSSSLLRIPQTELFGTTSNEKIKYYYERFTLDCPKPSVIRFDLPLSSFLKNGEEKSILMCV